MNKTLAERLEACAKDCDIYSPDQCATLIDGIGHIAMRHLLNEAARAVREAGVIVGYVDGARLHELREGRLNVALWAEPMGSAQTPVYATAPTQDQEKGDE